MLIIREFMNITVYSLYLFFQITFPKLLFYYVTCENTSYITVTLYFFSNSHAVSSSRLWTLLWISKTLVTIYLRENRTSASWIIKIWTRRFKLENIYYFGIRTISSSICYSFICIHWKIKEKRKKYSLIETISRECNVINNSFNNN